jgi:hypothetical protein
MSEHILDGYLTLPQFAQQVNRHPRTVRRWMNQPDGLPYINMGNTILLKLQTSCDWLDSKERRPNPTPSRRRRAA